MQKMQLSIPEPCHENWQQMTATEQGRFCNACAKEVIDFSTMTDIQVLNYFNNIANEKVCGRALPEQLDRPISRPEPPKKKLFWYWNYIVLFFMFFTKGNAAKAQRCTKPVTELNPVNDTGIRGQMIAMDTAKSLHERMVSGKIADENGNPVPFASVRVKGTSMGIATDANGSYSLKIRSMAVMIISAAGFKEAEIPVGTQAVLNIIMEKSGAEPGKVVVVMAGGMRIRNMDNYIAPVQTRSVAIIKVKEAGTNKFLPNVSVIINSGSLTDTVFTDEKGAYKIKMGKDHEAYFIRIVAEGYEPNEFTIDGSDFNDRKKEWEVLLKKQPVKPAVTAKAGDQKIVRLGAVQLQNIHTAPIYVVDGAIVPDINSMNPDDVDNMEVLQGPAAAALFGIEAMNGAIVITTRKAKEKKLDTVTVTGYGRTTGKLVRTITCSYTIRERIADTVKVIATKINGTVKIYPNPVQHGQQFSIALKLKYAGIYQMQITDAAGRIVLQEKINATSKEVLETIMPDGRWSSGLYYLSIIDNKNQLALKTSFIFE